MSFSAKEAVPALDFDFRPHVECFGTIPEPSQKALKKFNKANKALLDGRTLEEIAQLPDEEQEAVSDGIKPNIAELCQGKPSLEDLDKLPFRLLQAFIGWLTGQFQNPT